MKSRPQQKIAIVAAGLVSAKNDAPSTWLKLVNMSFAFCYGKREKEKGKGQGKWKSEKEQKKTRERVVGVHGLVAQPCH